MKTITKTLPVKGLHTPAPVNFLHGVINGRMKTAFVDSENKLISAYMVNKAFLFAEAAEKRIILLEKDLAAVRTEAHALMKEMAQLEPLSAEMPPDDMDEECILLSESVQESYLRREEAKRRSLARQKHDQLLARRQEILTRLIEIRDRLKSKELVAYKELEATADALKARFSTYCHGVLLRPVYRQYIDDLDFSESFEAYKKAHDELDREITDFLNEEGSFR